jgi:hypothetical protein
MQSLKSKSLMRYKTVAVSDANGNFHYCKTNDILVFAKEHQIKKTTINLNYSQRRISSWINSKTEELNEVVTQIYHLLK